MCAVHNDGLLMWDIAGQNSSATAVSKAWQDTAHCHLAASLAAAVPVPPMPAMAPAAGANPPRHVLADLYLQTEHAVFDPDFRGLRGLPRRRTMQYVCAHSAAVGCQEHGLPSPCCRMSVTRALHALRTTTSSNCTVMPLTITAYLVKHCTHLQTFDGSLCCFAESHAAVASATKQSTAAALLLKGLPWNRAAAPSLAAVSALTHLSCHGDAPSQERSLAFAQLAQHAAMHKGYRAAEQVSFSASLSVHPLHMPGQPLWAHGPINKW